VCQPSDMSVLNAVLAAFTATYGSPSRTPRTYSPPNQLSSPSPTSAGRQLTTGPPLLCDAWPRGPITPKPTVRGGPIVPCSPSHPSDKRQLPVWDPTALLEALTFLKSSSSPYGSGTIPFPCS
jgi:hypothetical protein